MQFGREAGYLQDLVDEGLRNKGERVSSFQ